MNVSAGLLWEGQMKVWMQRVALWIAKVTFEPPGGDMDLIL